MFSSRTPPTLTPNRLTIALARLRAEGRAIVDLTVSNPTCVGFHYPADLLAPLAGARALGYNPHPFGAIEARGAALIGDEVFADYELEPGAARRAGRLLDRCDVLAFGLGGLSKSAGLPQVKLGWIAVAGPGELVEAALERLELLCDTYLSV